MTTLTPAALGPLADDKETLAQAQRRQEEQHELFRVRACALMADKEWVRKADPGTLAWAKQWAAIKPLGRALGTGEVA